MGILLWREEEDKHFDRDLRAVAHLHMTSVAYTRVNNLAWNAARITGFLPYQVRLVDSSINYPQKIIEEGLIVQKTICPNLHFTYQNKSPEILRFQGKTSSYSGK